LSFGFPQKRRLGHQKEFQALFSTGKRFYGHWIDVIALPNALAYPRLGVIVGRKQAKKAVLRNAAKRQVREAFRLMTSSNMAVDIVVRIKRPFTKEELKALRDESEKLLNRAYSCYNASLSS